MESLDNLEIENPCQYCGRKNPKSIGGIKQETQFILRLRQDYLVNMKQFNAVIAEYVIIPQNCARLMRRLNT